MKHLTVTENDAGRRADQFLRRQMPALPQGLLYRAFRLGKIKLGGKKIKGEHRLCAGDMLSIYLEDEFFAKAPAPRDFLHAPRGLSLVFEDENIIIADKPAGLLCHADDREFADTLISRIQRHLYDKGEFDPDAPDSFTPALANRIDRNTCGLVLAAKNAEALRILNEKIKCREIEKSYLCLVHGTPPREFFCENFLKKDSSKNLVRVFESDGADRKLARTELRRLGSKNGCSLLLARLITGRTHQIRAQLAHAGYPLVGDGKYGQAHGANKKQFLCAYTLRFAFKTPAGALGYLNGREFRAAEPWFVTAFREGG
jgi:23S rRNA pseudouridine955/2504/2580 synthase